MMKSHVKNINDNLRATIAEIRTTTFKIPDDTTRKDYSYTDSENGNTIHVTSSNRYLSASVPSSGVEHNNSFDIYSPVTPLKSNPTILWVHGGAFIGGGKSDNENKMVNFLNHWSSQGYTIISVNYGLAPENPYPTQVSDIANCVKYLKEHYSELPINLNNLFFGGNSAGAQIISQFILTQLNPIYSKKIGIQKLLTREQMKAVILYCGPYNLNSIGKDKDSNIYQTFKYVGWSLFNPEHEFIDWYNSDKSLEMTIIGLIANQSDFIPAYVTDGDEQSFSDQGKKFIEKLSTVGVDVKAYFPRSDKTTILGHDYQFNLGLSAAQESLKKTNDWIDKYRVK